MAKLLAEYNRKRDFGKTPEPAGREHAPRRDGGAFVVQKHDATRLHYDFRLEIDGVLKSWAVPKGPSLDPEQKRLAVETEDHPLEYGSFEGVIPKGQYGGGPVILWDRGTWTPQGDAGAAYRKGHLRFALDGEKMKGLWDLIRIRGRDDDDGRQWLLVKAKDAHATTGKAADLPARRPESVETGRRIEELDAAKDPSWQSNRVPKNKGRVRAAARPAAAPRARKRSTSKTRRGPTAVDAASIEGARRGPLPATPGAQLCTLVESAPDGDEWVHEIKFDGYRILARVDDGAVRLLSRNGKDWTARFRTVADAVESLGLRSALFDGEVVRHTPDGKTSFQALQAALSGEHADELVYVVFDLLHLDGHDLARVPLVARKEALASVVGETGDGVLRLSEHVVGSGPAFFEAACRHGLEGIVSKRADGLHTAARTREWLKVRCGKRQEMVIVGYAEHSADPKAVGALLLAVHDEEGVLRWAGKVGTGFTEAVRRDLKRRLDAIATDDPPVVGAPPMRDVVWAAPKLVGEVAFTEWTNDGVLRHPSFQGLREDKRPQDVVREREAPAPRRDRDGEPEEDAMPARSPDRDAPTPRPATSRRGSRTGTTSPASTRARETAGDSFAGITLTNPDRVVWPATGTRKRDLAAFYVDVAEAIVPHVAGRPLTLVRCPQGHGAPCFFQKHPLAGTPAAVGQVMIREEGGEAPYLVVSDVAGVVALVQMGALEFHTWGSRADDVEKPDRIVMDLDPAEDLPFSRVVETARELRDEMRSYGLTAFVKTTGGKGLHVVVPLVRRHTWGEVKAVSRAIAYGMAQREPSRWLAKASKAERKGKIFVDWLRNLRGATAVAAYSTRNKPRASVSMPLSWDALEKTKSADAFTLDNAREHVRRRKADPWEGYDASAASLVRAKKALDVRPDDES
jgi:bifunctional non-homologous end joining protein LigD